MYDQKSFGNRGLAKERSLVPSELVELPITMLNEVSGGEIGSGLIVVPKRTNPGSHLAL